MIGDDTVEGMTKLLRGLALAAFAVNLPTLVQIMRRPAETEEDKVIRAAVSYVIAELHLARGALDEDSSAGVAGSPDDSGSGA